MLSKVAFMCILGLNHAQIIEKDTCGQDMLDQFRVSLRQAVRTFIDYANQNYSPKIVTCLVTPMIAYLDEHIRITLQPSALRWDAFQAEFLNRNDLGEHFFSLADDIIQDDFYPPEVYASFYLALRFGFCGQYYDHDPAKLHLYQKHIQRELQLRLPNDLDTTMLAEPQVNKFPEIPVTRLSKFKKSISIVKQWLGRQHFKVFAIGLIALPVFLYFLVLLRF